jgi:hypothetical protein
MVKAAASALNGVPSWKVTPSRSLRVHSVSVVAFHSVASLGSSSPLVGLRSIRGSVTFERTTTPVDVRFDSQASSVGGSWPSTTRTVVEEAAPASELATEQPLRPSTATDARAGHLSKAAGNGGFEEDVIGFLRIGCLRQGVLLHQWNRATRSGRSGRAGLKLVEVHRLHKVSAGRRSRAAGPLPGTGAL